MRYAAVVVAAAAVAVVEAEAVAAVEAGVAATEGIQMNSVYFGVLAERLYQCQNCHS